MASVESQFTIVNEKRFIEATRSSGYKSTASALAELIDNALQAQACEVTVHFRLKDREPEASGRAMRRVNEVVVVDDGYGMNADTLREALRFGGSTRFNDRQGLGRFRMGLPNASFNQCRRLEVYTREEGRLFNYSFLDIDEISAGNLTVVPEPRQVKLPKSLDAYFLSPGSGTVVVWSKCDKLDFDGRDETLANKTISEVGRMFRRFIWQGALITIHGANVDAIDPLFLDERARYTGAKETFSRSIPIVDASGSTKGSVRVRLSLLPEEWQVGKHDDADLDKLINSRQQGFSVLRNEREVDIGLFNKRSAHWIGRWWAGEIEFPPHLDDDFHITHTKQQIKVEGELLEALKKELQRPLTAITNRIVERGKKSTSDRNTRKAEDIAAEFETFLGPVDHLVRKPKEQIEAEICESARLFPKLDNIEQRIRTAHEQKRPFQLDFEDEPGEPFFRYREIGTVSVLVINRQHSFFDRLYQPLCDASGDANLGVELLLLSMVKAQQILDPQPGALDGLLETWSSCLSAYLSGPVSNITMKKQKKPGATP